MDDKLFSELRGEFSEPQLVELATAIAWENHRSRFNRTFGIAAEGYSEGAFCPMLERVGSWTALNGRARFTPRSAAHRRDSGPIH